MQSPKHNEPQKTHTKTHQVKVAKVKDKERILKAATESQLVTYKGAVIRLSGDFSTEMLQARRYWYKIFKVMKSKDLQLRVLYSVHMSFKIEGEIKSFITTKPGE